MDLTKSTLRTVGETIAYLLLGLAGTTVTGIALLSLTQGVQTAVYHAVYLQVGPSEATETAILTHFLAVAAVALSVPTFVADYVSDRLANARTLAWGVGGLVVVLTAFFLAALGGAASFLTALLAVFVAFLGVPFVLWYYFEVRSGGISAFVGGAPVVAFGLLLVGFGLGWGWGYTVVAHEVPDETAANGPVADFEDAPAVQDDLFAASNCETDAEDREVCYLSLRGYEHEREAARVLAENGVRCPYGNDDGSGGEVFVRHDGAYYRVTCTPHGD